MTNEMIQHFLSGFLGGITGGYIGSYLFLRVTRRALAQQWAAAEKLGAREVMKGDEGDR